MEAATSTMSSSGEATMDWRLMEAATTGDAVSMEHLAAHYRNVLLGTTPEGNTCLHIASVHGHEVFCKAAVALNPRILAAVNAYGETPLLSGVTSGRVSLASVLLRCCRNQQMNEIIFYQDNRGFNMLHHAIRSGHRELALELIEAEPALSRAVNYYSESPMFIAAMRNYEDVLEKLLEIPDSADAVASGFNALHAAVRNGNSAITKKFMDIRPGLAREQNESGNTPMELAVLWGKVDVLRVLLEHDRSLGYVISSDGIPLLNSAAYGGYVGVARELLKHCPDAPCWDANGRTCLHQAVKYDQNEFVEFVLGTPQLRKLVNMRDLDGNTALHHAVRKYNPKMVASLLLHQDRDVTVLNRDGYPAIWALFGDTNHANTLINQEADRRTQEIVVPGELVRKRSQRSQSGLISTRRSETSSRLPRNHEYERDKRHDVGVEHDTLTKGEHVPSSYRLLCTFQDVNTFQLTSLTRVFDFPSMS